MPNQCDSKPEILQLDTETKTKKHRASERELGAIKQCENSPLPDTRPPTLERQARKGAERRRGSQ